ncbi:ribosome-associated protein [Parvibaculum indicum]|uniref:alternative ribosome rescue aminoacyl-tRNA hydrolase ArfB n=1 Tax=Parvibaculum indicum TaxID=562969 RepID=UPI001422DB74|nr:alternative ribosome rescue aminoacyl-tRNA hydrolase ArfB [Parvibaculum indicum]NIJ41540.1 ribosome-associated protein [Parvibaculum indicum]
MIEVTERLSLAEEEIVLSFIRSGGPGGQNVNKVATAAQLRFDARHSPSLPPTVRNRLQKLAGGKLTRDGVIVITANRYRTQEENRKDAIGRLLALIREAAVPPRPRIPTRPTRASKKRHLEHKKRRGDVKKMRRRPTNGD